MAERQSAVLIDTVTALHDAGVPVTRASVLTGMPRSSYYRSAHQYRHYRPVTAPIAHADRDQPAALSETERETITTVLLSEEHADHSVVQVYWRAFDAGIVSCSQSTFYRVARRQNLTGDRRRRRTGGATLPRRTPVRDAAGPGDLWSWDITILRGPRRQDRYLLYLAIDVFSRFPVAWRIETAERAAFAVEMFTEAFATFGVPQVLHADNGSSMRSQGLLDALEAAGVDSSYSRPRVSNDNPFSESLFKTLKYDLTHPERFDDIEHARAWTEQFLQRYATDHRHSGLGRCTPSAVFFGLADEVHQRRQEHLDRAWAQHPHRYRRRPTAPALPSRTGINIHHDLSQTG